MTKRALDPGYVVKNLLAFGTVGPSEAVAEIVDFTLELIGELGVVVPP
ncbi:hypothetical protein J2Y63_004186 [Shinella sp. BE166]